MVSGAIFIYNWKLCLFNLLLGKILWYNTNLTEPHEHNKIKKKKLHVMFSAGQCQSTEEGYVTFLLREGLKKKSTFLSLKL